MPAELVTLYDKSALDIPAMLRMAADNIEKGEAKVKSMIAVQVSPEGDIQVMGWGATNSVDALATLQLAILKEGRRMLGE